MATIHRTLEHAGLSVKRIQKLAPEHDPLAQADFICCIGPYPTNYLVTIDEVSKDDQTYACLWGRAPRGQWAEQHQLFVCKRCFSLVGAMALGRSITASRVLEGSFTHNTYYEYLHDDVLPLMSPYP
ncbi:hypothetical protein BDN67DRAFT_903809 [Paxillus ammoniavirescens]|nr:hypothetical protein BDN67DRAFT_903809 [Paxillus ammoniavirescens]